MDKSKPIGAKTLSTIAGFNVARKLPVAEPKDKPKRFELVVVPEPQLDAVEDLSTALSQAVEVEPSDVVPSLPEQPLGNGIEALQEINATPQPDCLVLTPPENFLGAEQELTKEDIKQIVKGLTDEADNDDTSELEADEESDDTDDSECSESEECGSEVETETAVQDTEEEQDDDNDKETEESA